MYQCTKFDAFVQICTFIPLTALTRRRRRMLRTLPPLLLLRCARIFSSFRFPPVGLAVITLHRLNRLNCNITL